MGPSALADAQQRFVKLHFQVYGEGKPVVIIHGLFGSLENWHTISLGLAAQFQVYAVDLRNHGRSPHDPLINYDVMAADIAEFMADQKIGEASLIGHSLGGKVAMQLALTDPARVAKLVVADMAPREYEPHHETILTALLSLPLESLQTRRQAEHALESKIPDLAVRRFLLKNLKRNAEGQFFWQNNLRALQANYPHLAAGVRTDRVFDKPALFLRGELSDYLRPEDEPLIRRLFPHSEIRTVAGAGHWMHAEVPETFLRNVQEFLRD